jgi:hypothetical protein
MENFAVVMAQSADRQLFEKILDPCLTYTKKINGKIYHVINKIESNNIIYLSSPAPEHYSSDGGKPKNCEDKGEIMRGGTKMGDKIGDINGGGTKMNGVD